MASMSPCSTPRRGAARRRSSDRTWGCGCRSWGDRALPPAGAESGELPIYRDRRARGPEAGGGRRAARGGAGPRVRPAAGIAAARHGAGSAPRAGRGDASPAERATTWWASALRFLGCTGHAFEVAVVFGDEIELRAESLRADAANPVEFLRLTLTHAGPGQSGLNRLRSVLAAVAGGRRAAEMNFRTACEVADAFAQRLRPGRAGPRGAGDELRALERPRPASRGEGRPRSHVRCGSRSSARSSRCWPASRASRAHWRSSSAGAARPTTPSWLTWSCGWARAGGTRWSPPTPGRRRWRSRRPARPWVTPACESRCWCWPTSPTSSRRGPAATRVAWPPWRCEACGPDGGGRGAGPRPRVVWRCPTRSGTRPDR